MKTVTLVLAALFSLALGGCATPAAPVRDEARLFADQLFQPTADRIDAADVFALDQAMLNYAAALRAQSNNKKTMRDLLVEAVYNVRALRLDYDTSRTRNAAQAFADKQGNCLSLVIMAGALARELGLSVRYNRVLVDDTMERSGSMVYISGHLNLTMSNRPVSRAHDVSSGDEITIDFLPPEELEKQRSTSVDERTVIAMYMNNQAAELLSRGERGRAYWWARAALRQAPAYLDAYNTLGVIYLKHGHPALAERAFDFVLAHDDAHAAAMTNLLDVYGKQGRDADLAALTNRLADRLAAPPFHFYTIGMSALSNGDFAVAKRMFEKEVARAPRNHEFHFRLAAAHFKLGEIASAERQLALAQQLSAGLGERGLYAAKLETLRHQGR